MAKELVLLTGGTGFLGSAILVELLKAGYRVRVAARSQAKIDKVLAAPSIVALDPPATELTFVLVPDMTAPGAYDEAVKEVDFIIHTAAPLSGTKEGAAKDELADSLVKTSVQGNLSILNAAQEKGKTVRRVVFTSSTVAIAPPEIYLMDTKERDIVRGPDTRVAASAPPYSTELHAYCAGKAAALNASEAFLKDNPTSFDLVSIMPSWIFGKDELATTSADLRTGSTKALIHRLQTSQGNAPTIGNIVLCSDVALAHVRALDENIKGNQAFILNVDGNWEDTIPIAKKYFPDAFKSGLFQESSPHPTISLKWDSSKVSIRT